MVLLRRVLGEALRHHRSAQRRTLREVSAEANVSLGYLSEIERGHKEPSSELLAAVCAALELQLSQLLAEVSKSVAQTEGSMSADAQPLERQGMDDSPSESADSAPAEESAPSEQPVASVKLLGAYGTRAEDATERSPSPRVAQRPDITACLPTSLSEARSRRRLPGRVMPVVEAKADVAA
ncbi:helix-turn-helix domain-containing protein [Natronoglycomyces albus]|uniref:Helix-turn-helix transcriptional regulator n=1 Tax=Natronoglycomyces albus TaxID=2811108 RepID=A0A895XKG3_9ACTN|nr:helix-turn-helix transcriptional regulator [Natronoglycomyces albus]QSB04302.1 helix-turn-helix transcriptional regulator [Natronoglycomyces albus]